MLGGLFPYLLGSTIACYSTGAFYFNYFLLGLIGIVLALGTVEIFNEYFDVKLGTDRVFDFEENLQPPSIKLGVIGLTVALSLGLYLAVVRGWLILVFLGVGILAIVGYEGPPFRWSYRGFGELSIFLAYGPFMTMGSYYLQAQEIHALPLITSLIIGLPILALSIINEIPDYHGDRLVGKKNIVVRIGRKNAVNLYAVVLVICFMILASGLILEEIPFFTLAIFAMIPLAYWNYRAAKKNYDNPKEFTSTIRGTILLYIIIAILLIISFLI
ncbi:hypothetical protein AKJ63_01635 [candidate division MSBL1 archaeon SCGC-AAA259D18]|uniref:1,4-dihydroxy-2-naphthoate octaprenyltransferase n=1 Tax=candidate division MSBL1 archaeon SCGC-AAA259D18 TaxID=1698262 RepID=A0A133UAX5_9EURY|nr:hypothetical protein AKJ63_01635 [candidate division MSBL1 archaeon SCGC-AAA259D18]